MSFMDNLNLRRAGHEFCAVGSRILRDYVPESPMGPGFLAKGVEQGARVRAVKAAAEPASGRHCASTYESTAKLNR
jgi:hypothetical protein